MTCSPAPTLVALFHQSLDFVKRWRYEDRVIFTSPLPPVALPESPLTPYVLERAKERADETALVDGPTGCRVSYAELDAAVRGQAGGWLERGLTKGEVVAVMAPNCPEYAITFHAVALAGGVVTTINPTYTPGEVHHQLVDSGATRLVTAPMFVETATAASNGTKITAGETFVIGESLANVTATPLQEQVPVELDDVVALPYSSGTTGTSKGVRLTHRNLTANIAQTLAAIPTDEDDAFVAVLPFFHIYGMQVLMNLGLRAGATVVTMPRFDLEQFLQLHQEHRLTRAFVAPPMVVALAKHPIVEEYDLSALQTVFSGAAPLSADLADEAARRLGCEVIQGYGMTELSPVSHATPPGQFKPGSVGVAVPATEVQIVDPATGTALGEDEDGEVWIRGPQVMAGYLNNEEATKGHHRRRRLAPHRRHRPRRQRRPPLRRRPPEGAHQVQGLPSRPRGARGAAAHTPEGRRRRGDRPSRRRSRRAPSCVRGAEAAGDRRPPRRSSRSSPVASPRTSRFAR